MSDKDITVTNKNGQFEIWLRGVFYTRTPNIDFVIETVRYLKFKNRRIAC